MRSTSMLRRLVVALSVLSVSHALSLDGLAAAQDNAQDVNKRATLSLSVGLGGPDASSTTTTDSPSSTPPTKTTDATTTTDKTTSTTPTSTTSTTPTSTSKSTDSTTSTSSSSSQSTTTITTVFVTTDASGSTTSVTSESASTISAGLAQGSGGSTSGMSPQTRNTVIGVVVGIGGAIILLVIGLLAWRIWGRKRTPDENDGFANYGGTGAGAGYSVPEKSEASGSTSGRTPFQSTLESYHAPTQVNTASNF